VRFQGLDLNLLVALDRLFKDRSVVVAAKNLHLSPSALSHALTRLRAHFQDELLTPVGRHLALTPLAETLAAPLQEALNQVQTVVSGGATFDPSTTQQTFTVLASDYCIAVCLAEAIGQISKVAPGIAVRVGNLDAPVARLERQDADLIILPQQHLAPEHPRANLYDDSYVLAVWAGSKLASEPIDVERYYGLAHVATRFGDGPGALEDLALAAPRQRRVSYAVPTFSSVPLLLPGTDLVATLPERLAKIAARFLPLALRPVPFPTPTIRQQAQWHTRRDGDPAIGWFVDIIRGASLS
jgi:LysR family transcriptional regulator, nod-box dependent transcriptional activator